MRRGFFRNKKAVEEPTTADIMAVVGTIVIAVSIVVVFSVNIPSSIESAEVVLEEAETGAAARMMMSTILSSYDENLDMTGAQIISRMGADRQWAQAVGLDEIDEIVPLARVGDFCLLRPSSELYEDYIVDYDIDELTFTTGALQFPPDYFERIQSSDLSWWQGICMSSNTEDPCEDFT
ncbi:TPA: hypothetical protein H1011_00880, partial [archaeon]|nr:hypothetical protein [Candidatus Undinarchaeum marinum]